MIVYTNECLQVSAAASFPEIRCKTHCTPHISRTSTTKVCKLRWQWCNDGDNDNDNNAVNNKWSRQPTACQPPVRISNFASGWGSLLRKQKKTCVVVPLNVDVYGWAPMMCHCLWQCGKRAQQKQALQLHFHCKRVALNTLTRTVVWHFGALAHAFNEFLHIYLVFFVCRRVANR